MLLFWIRYFSIRGRRLASDLAVITRQKSPGSLPKLVSVFFSPHAWIALSWTRIFSSKVSLNQLVRLLRPLTSVPGTAGAAPAVEVTLETFLLGRVALESLGWGAPVVVASTLSAFDKGFFPNFLPERIYL